MSMIRRLDIRNCESTRVCLFDADDIDDLDDFWRELERYILDHHRDWYLTIITRRPAYSECFSRLMLPPKDMRVDGASYDLRSLMKAGRDNVSVYDLVMVLTSDAPKYVDTFTEVPCQAPE